MMTDSTLQRVWASREAISRRCDFDAHKLVQFYQSRQDPDRTSRCSRLQPRENGGVVPIEHVEGG